MIAVIFEAWPHPDHRQHYLELAADLNPLLQGIDGFLSIERFEAWRSRASCSHCPSGAMNRPSPSGAPWNATEAPSAWAGPGSSSTTASESLRSGATMAWKTERRRLRIVARCTEEPDRAARGLSGLWA